VESGRLEAFSDGVFAVAITLLALNLTVAHPGRELLGQQLADHWPVFAAYVVSFMTIGIIWVNHHAMVANFAHVDRPLLFLNLLLLFFVVSIPFATATLADYLRLGGADASLAAAIYQGVFLGMSLSFGGLFWWSISRSHLRVPLSGANARRALIRFGGGIVVYAAAIGVAYLSATASLLIDALLAVYYIFEQTPQSRSESSLSRTMRGDSQAVAPDRDRRYARASSALTLGRTRSRRSRRPRRTWWTGRTLT
jgi:uncharacterized membrane protein